MRSTSAARKARAAGSAPDAMKRRIGSSMDERAIMQHGANVSTTVKVATRDGQAKKAGGRWRIKQYKEG